MTIDYVEEILKLKRKINKGEVSIDDVITDAMMDEIESSGHAKELLQHGIDNALWVPSTVLDKEKCSPEMIAEIKKYVESIK